MEFFIEYEIKPLFSIRRLSLFWAVGVLIVLTGLHQSAGEEALRSRVVDEASVFSGAEKEKLNSALEKFREQIGVDLVILLVSSLGGESIEKLAEERFRLYEIGSKNLDNGLLFVAVVSDRKMRLEVGYGLEASIPDITAKSILDTEVRPYFKEKKYYEGVESLMRRLSSAPVEIRGEKAREPAPFVARAMPLFFSILFFFVVYFLGFRPPGNPEKENLDSVFGKDWPREATSYRSREAKMIMIRKILVWTYGFITGCIGIYAFTTMNDWYVIGCIVANFSLPFLFVPLMSLTRFTAKWKKWHREYPEPFRKKIEKILKGSGLAYSATRDEFISTPTRSSNSEDSSDSSSSSPSDGGKSGGGGANSDW